MALVEVSKKVFVRRKPMVNAFFLQNAVAGRQVQTYQKIGSYMSSGGGTGRGLQSIEEPVYFPKVLSVSKDDILQFDRQVKYYWDNIGVEIPENTGKELEVGFIYNSEEDRITGEQLSFFNTGLRESEYTRYKYGVPINIENYIFFRFCLESPAVANKLEDVEKSNKIKFYLYSKDAEVNDKYKQYKIRTKANARYNEIIGNRALMNTIIHAYDRFDLTDDREKDMFLEQEVRDRPEVFLTLIDDGDLQMRAFIQNCISKGYLQKSQNSESVLASATDILGTDMNDAIAHLRSERRSGLLIQLQARMKLTPTQGSESIVNKADIVNPIDLLAGNKGTQVIAPPTIPAETQLDDLLKVPVIEETPTGEVKTPGTILQEKVAANKKA